MRGWRQKSAGRLAVDALVLRVGAELLPVGYDERGGELAPVADEHDLIDEARLP